jgi:hypothetical protein
MQNFLRIGLKVLFFTPFFYNFSYGQQVASPGGLNSDLRLWLKADEGVTQNGSVISWSDFSGNGLTAISTTSPPQYVAGGTGSLPYIAFDRTSSNFLKIPGGIFNNTSSVTNNWTYVVASTDNFAGSSGTVFNEMVAGGYYALALPYLKSAKAYFGLHPSSTSMTEMQEGLPMIISYGIAVNGNSIDGTQSSMWLNGTQTFTSSVGMPSIAGSNKDFFIGGGFLSGRNNPSIRSFDGRIYEIIVLNADPESVEHERVQSYLAIKYGIQKVSNDIPSTTSLDERDYFSSSENIIWDHSEATGFNQNIAGIGRDDLSGLDMNSTSNYSNPGIIGLHRNGSFLNDETFLLTGDNGESGILQSNLGNGLYAYSNRIWHVQSTGNSEVVDLYFNLDKFGYNISSNANDYVVISSGSQDFSSSNELGIGSSLVNGVLIVNDVDLSTVDYFRLALSSVNLTAPFEGPGDVDDGIALWLRADIGVTGTTAITSWTDQSGNNNHATATTTAPSLVTNDINGYPAIDFDGSGQYMSIDEGVFKPGILYKDFWTYTVVTSDKTSTNSVMNELVDRQSGGSGFVSVSIPYSNSSTLAHYMATGFSLSNSNPEAGSATPHVFATAYSDDNIPFSAFNKTEIWVDGSTRGASNSNMAPVVGTNTDMFIGAGWRGFHPGSFYRDGKIAEVIVYQAPLTALNHQKILSYLCLKYGISKKSENIASSVRDDRDYFASDNSVIWDYDQGHGCNRFITGIGRDDESGFNQVNSKAADSTDDVGNVYSDILTIQPSGSFTNDLSFVLWGNDDKGYDKITEGPFVGAQRLEQTWFVQKTGTVGNLDLVFDINAYAFSLPKQGGNFFLLVDSDGDRDFSNATSLGVPDIFSNKILYFNDRNIPDNVHIALGFSNDIRFENGAFAGGTGANGEPGTSDGNKSLIVLDAGARITADARIKSLSVESGASLEIEDNVAFVLRQGIVNNGEIFLGENTSLVQEGSSSYVNSGSGTYEILRSGWSNINAANFFSSPVKDAPLIDIPASGHLGVFHNTNPCGIYVFNASTQAWKYDYPIGTTADCGGGPLQFNGNHAYTDGVADNLMDVGRGYLVPGSPDMERIFVGNEINNGEYFIPIHWNTGGNNVNLLGNPYPSGIDIFNFLATNEFELEDGFIYLLDMPGTGGYGYGVVNMFGQYVGGQNGMGTHTTPPTSIASGQGFYVLADEFSSGAIYMDNFMRTGANNQFYKAQETIEHVEARFFLSNKDNETQSMVISINENATSGKDWSYDAPLPKLWSDMSLSSELEGRAMLIQTFHPNDFVNTTEIPIQIIVPTPGKYRLNMGLSNWPENLQLFLKNVSSGQIISIENEYVFNVQNIDDVKNVYSLVISNQGAKSGNTSSSQGMKIYQLGEELTIVPSEDLGDNQEISILDSRGVNIHTFGKGWSSYTYNTDQLASGVYLIVNTINGEKHEVQKIVIH